MKNRISLLTLTIIVLVLTAIHSLAQSIYEPYTFTTLAGNAGYGNSDGAGSAARFQSPAGLAVDNAGNVYVADTGNDTIRKVTPAGVVTTLAGLAGIDGSADGTGNHAQFYQPSGVAVDSAGNVYVADTHNQTIRKLTPTGVVTTLAGLAGSAGSDDGTGSDARFAGAIGVAVDSAGNVYVMDSGNRVIRKVTPARVVTTLAGQFGGNPISGSGPTDVAVDSAGNLYVADTANNTIRKVTPAGVVTTLAGLPPEYDISGNLVAEGSGSADGTWSDARFFYAQGVAVDNAGNVYVADTQNNTIRKVTPAGVVTTLAGLAQFDANGNPVPGSADGTGSVARFRYPTGVAVDSSGNVYVADAGNSTIRKVTPEGVVTSLAGLAGTPGSADGTGSDARFWLPSGVAADSAGNVYVADTENNTIRKVTPTGVVTTLAGRAGSQGSTDETGSAARFYSPTGVAVDSAGIVYVADWGNSTIRKVTTAGVVTTLAGLTVSFGSADGAGSDARFRGPTGVAVDSAGNVYVADTVNNTIRRITPDGVVTTLAGLPPNDISGNFGGRADGTGSAARFSYPYGVAVDSAGNVYVADSANNTIRKGYPAPMILNSGAGFGFNGGQFGFNLAGPARRSVVVEASTDLVSWLPLWTNTFTFPAALNFGDAQSGASSTRFYRARLP